MPIMLGSTMIVVITPTMTHLTNALPHVVMGFPDAVVAAGVNVHNHASTSAALLDRTPSYPYLNFMTFSSDSNDGSPVLTPCIRSQ